MREMGEALQLKRDLMKKEEILLDLKIRLMKNKLGDN